MMQRFEKRGVNLSAILGALLWGCMTSFGSKGVAQEGEGSPRMTPLVKVIQQIEPAVVALFTQSQNQLQVGSGTVIHEDGYVLTNNHVLPTVEGYALLPKSKPIHFRVVGRIPELDFAIIKLDVTSKLPTVKLGRSDDLMNGESIAVAGNPGGRGTTFSSGIVSCRDLLEGGPNALIMTNYENSRRDTYIQFDAASNRGNSGGPLVNMEGELIGIVSAVVPNEQNVGLAIPVDRVRREFQRLLETELVRQAVVGLTTDLMRETAIVSSVEPNSPAAQSGIQVGDEILSVNGKATRHGIDWLLNLESELAPKGKLTLVIRRGETVSTIPLVVGNPERWEGVPTDKLQLQAGLRYDLYSGKYHQLPDFSALPVKRSGTVETLDLATMSRGEEEYFCLRIRGYFHVQEEGLYRILLQSDDGSRMRLHGKLIIDNDGNHPPKAVGGMVRLGKGLHPIEIEYFQGNGAKSLQLFWERAELREQLCLKPVIPVEAKDFQCRVDVE